MHWENVAAEPGADTSIKEPTRTVIMYIAYAIVLSFGIGYALAKIAAGGT